MRVLLILLLALGTVSGAGAEERRFGAYALNHGVVATRFLLPDVAARYGVERANGRALLNVALTRQAYGEATPVAARLEGRQGDLVNKRPLAFREVREAGSIYYIAEFPFRDGDTVYFDIAVMPAGDTATLRLQFSNTLYEE